MSTVIRIHGGHPLKGILPISGAKNAALPLLCASILTDEELILRNMPFVSDIRLMGEILQTLGVHVSCDDQEKVYRLKASHISQTLAPYDLVSQMRASFLVLGPLLARFGQARVSLPGGCAIGTRPVDIHLKGLQALGATINVNEGYVEAFAPQGLKGASIVMPMISVTGTEHLMMAACLAQGETRLIHAAHEPEIVDLAQCLRAQGAHIEGEGTDEIVIQGVSSLKGADYSILPDRIESGTYAIATLITGGEVTLTQTNLAHWRSLAQALQNAGAVIEAHQDHRVTVRAPNGPLESVDISTEPFPGFATDLQAQFMSLMCIASGTSVITETVFENRFMHVNELLRLGANIQIEGKVAVVQGVTRLSGATVMATDLRASASLVIAGLVAEGETVVDRIYHLDRGYDRMESKLRGLGADIERIR